MTTTINNLRSPKGTYGVACEIWGDIYALAADWAQASAVVWAYGSRGWFPTQYQVADFRHRPKLALARYLQDAMAASGGPGDYTGPTALELASRAEDIFSED